MTAENKSLKQGRYGSFLAHCQTELFLIGVLAVLSLLFENTSPAFFQLGTLTKLLKQASIYGIIAIGMVFVITSLGTDISVGFAVGLSGVTVAMITMSGIPIPIAILLMIASSILVGLFNGILVYDANVPPLTAMLGSLTIVGNFTLLIADVKAISDLPKVFTNFMADSLLGILYLSPSWAVFVCIGPSIAKKTIFGCNMYAYGSNREAARLSGVRARSVVYGTYIFYSSVCGVAGVLLASEFDSGVPNVDTGYGLDAIAATVVDGASLDGGKGSVIDTVLDATIMATLQQGGTLLETNSFIVEIIISSLIVIAVVLDKVRKKRN